jgi:glycine cleavage system H protein
MVVFLLLLTVAALLLLDWYLVHRRKRVEARSVAPPTIPTGTGPPATGAADLFLHPGHTWVRPAPDGLISIGVSDFAAHFAGELSGVEMPREGTRLGQGDLAWTLISRKQRRLTQVMPVDGEVVAVNSELARDPGLLQRSPYQDGWIVKARARRLGENLRNLLHGRAAKMWLEGSRTSLTAQLSPALGVLAHDGGEWITGFGDLLPDDQWNELRKQLFPDSGSREDTDDDWGHLRNSRSLDSEASGRDNGD